MQYIQFADSANTKTFVKNGASLVLNATEDTYVLLREPSKEELADILTDFRDRMLEELRNVLLGFPHADSGKIDGVENLPLGLSYSAQIVNRTSQGLRFHYARAGMVSGAIKALGFDRKYPGAPSEAAIFRVTRFERADALALMADVLGKTPDDFLDGISPAQHEWPYLIDLDLERDLAMASTALAFLDRLAGDCTDLFLNRRNASDRNRPIARYLYAKALQQAGILLFPRHVWSKLSSAVPSPFDSNDMLMVPHAASFVAGFREWLESNTDGASGTRKAYIKAFAFIDHTSNFGSSLAIDSDFFEAYRSWDRDGKDSFATATGIRLLWKYLHAYHDRKVDKDISALRLAGKIKSRFLEAWAWVDNPGVTTRSGRYEDIVGQREPTVQPPLIRAWAEQMRRILKSRRVKAPSSIESALTDWLLYLCKHPNPPASFAEINRSRHINSGSNPNHFTFMDFLRQRKISDEVRNRAMAQLRLFWELDSTMRGVDLDGCPVDLKIDKFKTSNVRRGRTHRRAIDQQIVEVIIRENRKDDFAFSRGRMTDGGKKKADYRSVINPTTGKVEKLWWPGPATIVDLLLNIPLRKMSARFLDSGEGDEFVLNRKSLQYEPNPLPTATEKRKEGFFVRKPDGIKRDVFLLGMYVNTNKTGAPYEVSWVESGVADNVGRLIDWQMRYNPISEPVLCRDHASQDPKTDTSLFASSFPIFRDPEDPFGGPLSEGLLDNYFEALLKHCEPIIATLLGFDINLFDINEKPIYDLHSLRVTGVTVLLENGVDPEIVKTLVGHSSLEMMWHYNAIRASLVHFAIQAAIEKRRAKYDDLAALSPEELEKLGTELTNLRDPQDLPGFDLLRGHVVARDRQWEMMADGICPGGSCQEGGELYKNAYQALPRERACSLCRFRLTGPMFLPGLIHTCNRLMWEIKESLNTARDLKDKAIEAEDAGLPTEAWRGQARREKEKSDQLWEEWFSAVRYARHCETTLMDWLEGEEQPGGESGLPAMLTRLDPEQLSAQVGEVHDLRLAHNLVKESQIIAGVSLPRGVTEDRNSMLAQIARQADMEKLMLKLDSKTAAAWFDRFGDAVLSTVTEDSQLEGLIDKSISVRDLPGLESKIAAAVEMSGATMFVAKGESKQVQLVH